MGGSSESGSEPPAEPTEVRAKRWNTGGGTWPWVGVSIYTCLACDV